MLSSLCFPDIQWNKGTEEACKRKLFCKGFKTVLAYLDFILEFEEHFERRGEFLLEYMPCSCAFLVFHYVTYTKMIYAYDVTS